ncbi:MAG: hypothetical protein ACPGR8_06300 [Limisphaerales bacterium]
MPGRSHHIQPTGERGTRYTGGAFGITGADFRRRVPASSNPPVLAKMDSKIALAFLQWPKMALDAVRAGRYSDAIRLAAPAAGAGYVAYMYVPGTMYVKLPVAYAAASAGALGGSMYL